MSLPLVESRQSAAASGANVGPLAVRYRALAGCFYDAKVLAERADGTLDVEVRCPGTVGTVFLSRRRVAADAETCAAGECYRVLPANAGCEA